MFFTISVLIVNFTYSCLNGIILFYFRPLNTIEIYKLKKRRCCAWDSITGHQNGRHRRIHWAMVAAYIKWLQYLRYLYKTTIIRYYHRSNFSDVIGGDRDSHLKGFSIFEDSICYSRNLEFHLLFWSKFSDQIYRKNWICQKT